MELLEFKDYSLSLLNKNEVIKLIDGFNYTIHTGDVVLLTGPNGSGKSSLIADLTGYDYRYKDNGTSLERGGSIFYYSDNKKACLNQCKSNDEKFKEEYLFISQNDDEPFYIVLDCFKSTLLNRVTNPEKYIFNFIKMFSCYPHILKKGNRMLNNKIKSFLEKIQEEDNAQNKMIAGYLLSKVSSLSGGQLKMLNIMSNLVKYEFCSLCIIDEPLNNLDYDSVRNFSNIIAKIHHEKPNLSFLIVTHCRSILSVNRMIEINPTTKKITSFEGDEVVCSSCFGISKNDFYL